VAAPSVAVVTASTVERGGTSRVAVADDATTGSAIGSVRATCRVDGCTRSATRRSGLAACSTTTGFSATAGALDTTRPESGAGATETGTAGAATSGATGAAGG